MSNDSNIRPYRDIEQFMGNLLRVGVIIAASVVLIGGIFFLFKNGQNYPDYKSFHGEPQYLRHLPEIFRNSFSLNGNAIIQLGFLFLIATPIARVFFSIYAFARERDFVYVVVTIIVLAVLIFGLAGGHL